MSVIIAALHYLALALGFTGVVLRGIRMKESLIHRRTQSVLAADNIWGLAALIWIITGILRVFGGYEKGSSYYLSNHWFYAKMFLFLVVFLLELAPMITFIKWRVKRIENLSEDQLPLLKKYIFINRLQILLILIIPFIAVCMARNYDL